MIQEGIRERVKEWYEQNKNTEKAIKTSIDYGKKALKAKSISEREFFNTRAIGVLNEEIERTTREPMLSTLYMSRGNLLIAGKNYEKAREDFENIPISNMDIVNDFSRRGIDLVKKVHVGLLSVEYGLGNYEKAVEHFIKFRIGENTPEEVFKDNELNHYSKGEMFFRYGRYDEAMKEYEEVLRIDPNFENETLKKFETQTKDMFFFKLAITEVGRKKFESAKKYCERALEINPKNKDARKALEKIEKNLQRNIS